MKQKVSLCCSLMHDPDLLVLDEPTTGVDPLSRRQFWELINSIRARRPLMSVIVATAYMDEASRFDWLAAMDDGKVIARGAPKEILAQAKRPRWTTPSLPFFHQKSAPSIRRSSCGRASPAMTRPRRSRRMG